MNSTASFDTNSYYVQALCTSLPKRLHDSTNSLILNTQPTGRQAKRVAAQINYAEDYVDDFESEDTPSVNNPSRSAANNNQQSQINVQKFTPAKKTIPLKDLEIESKILEQSHKPQIPIPIKLSVEFPNGNSKFVDFFTWDLNEAIITPSKFSEILCNDLDLPNSMQQQISESISQQIEDYAYVANLQLPLNSPYIVIIDLSVSLHNQLFQDRFEWDLNQSEITPETFAKVVVAESGLANEFAPAIAHALHENIIRIKKEIVDGTYNNELNNLHQLRGLIFDSGIRINTENSKLNGNDRWQPIVEMLTPSEIERRDLERSRNLRRLKRENAKRGDFDDFGVLKRRNLGSRRKFDELEGSWRNV